MNAKFFLAGTFATMLAAAPVFAQPVPVESLLGDTAHAVAVLQAEAELDGARHELNRDRDQQGWQLTGAAGYGIIKNIVSANQAISYPGAQGQLGFSYPLLDSSGQKQRAVDSASGKVEEKQARLEDARRRAPLELESDYARYWGAQEGMLVIDAYLATEPEVVPRLQLRQQKKLMLQSRLTELLAGYEAAHATRAQLQRVLDQTRGRLERLAGRSLADLQASAVALPEIQGIVADDVSDKNPDIAELRAKADALKAQLDDSSWYGMNASLNVTGAVNTDQRDHQTGGTGFVGLNFSAPLSLISVRREERERLQSELEGVRLQQRQRREELIAEAHAALGRLSDATEGMNVAAQKTSAAAEALRERQLRSNVFSEEGIEALSQQLNDYTRQALADIDARVRVWQNNIDVRAYVMGADNNNIFPHSQDAAVGVSLAAPLKTVAGMLQGSGGDRAPSTPVPALESGRLDDSRAVAPARLVDLTLKQSPTLRSVVWTRSSPVDGNLWFATNGPDAAAPPRATMVQILDADAEAPKGAEAPTMSVYVWNSHELIRRDQFQPTFWSLLQRLTISRLMISLNATQIQAAQTRPQELRAFLSNARKHDVAVDLLLGEPSWIEPAHRQELLNIIDSLRAFDFAGLHLDIEPDQIYRQPLSRAQFDDWVATLAAAAKTSPWPTAVSVHPRYFRDSPYHDWHLGEQLSKGGIREVALMIFSSDPNKVAAIAHPILAGSPNLRFQIAQSVEPQLDPTLSYARRSPQDFQAAMRELEKQMATEANADGVVVQAWADLARMGHESQIR
ncbi:MAG: TolC family protein [Stenotrophobium sp.]